MPIAFWRDEYNTGNSLIDSQHQNLFEIINRLHDAMLEGHGHDVISETLDEMAHYTITHFRDEETLMLEYDYPNYPPHKLKHDTLIKEVKALQIEFKKPAHQGLTIKVSRFLTNWLIHHIKGEDQKFMAFLKDHHTKSQLES